MNLSTDTNGDAALIDAVRRELAGSSRDHVSAAFIEYNRILWGDPAYRISPGTIIGRLRYANFGVTNDTHYEIGSLSKTTCGHLFADAIERGEVTANQAIGSLLPALTGAPAQIELSQLATHTGGFGHWIPASSKLETLCSQAMEIHHPEWVGQYHYSNTGVALLGQALSLRAGFNSYRDFIKARLFNPIGMTGAIAPVSKDHIPPGSPNGFDSEGTPMPSNPGGMNAPAFGVRSSIADLAKYGLAVMQGAAPGMDAITQHFPAAEDGQPIGWLWECHTYTDGDLAGRTTLRKTGSTEGFCAYIELDRENMQGIILLSDTDVSLAGAGRSLLYSGGN